MPNFHPRTGRAMVLPALLVSLLMNVGASAQTPVASEADKIAPEKIQNSALNAPLFQQLLIGEIEVREGDLAAGYQLLLDAARRTRDEQLFRRATDIALQARAGDESLAAVKAWRTALPDSVDALRYQVQILVQLNRTSEVVEPLQALIKATPPAERTALFSALPRFLARSNDRAQAAQIIEQVLLPYADAPETRVAARVSIGRGWLGAINGEKALALAQNAHEMDRSAEAPAGLALAGHAGRRGDRQRPPRRQARQQRGAPDLRSHAPRLAAPGRCDRPARDTDPKLAEAAAGLADARRAERAVARAGVGDDCADEVHRTDSSL